MTKLTIEEITYEWIICGPDGETLAYKKVDEDPVFIDAEAAVLQCVKSFRELENSYKNSQHLLGDLTRHL